MEIIGKVIAVEVPNNVRVHVDQARQHKGFGQINDRGSGSYLGVLITNGQDAFTFDGNHRVSHHFAVCRMMEAPMSVFM